MIAGMNSGANDLRKGSGPDRGRKITFAPEFIPAIILPPAAET